MGLRLICFVIVASAFIEFKHSHGYLSAVDFPLLPVKIILYFMYSNNLLIENSGSFVLVQCSHDVGLFNTRYDLALSLAANNCLHGEVPLQHWWRFSCRFIVIFLNQGGLVLFLSNLSKSLSVLLLNVVFPGAVTNSLLFINMAFANSSGNSVPALSWMSRVSAALQACATSALLMVASTGYGITLPKLSRQFLVMVAFMTSAAVSTRLAVIVVQDESIMVRDNF